jgi:hypothetical protein
LNIQITVLNVQKDSFTAIIDNPDLFSTLEFQYIAINDNLVKNKEIFIKENFTFQ